MAYEKTGSLYYFLQYIPIAVLLGIARLLPFDTRTALIGRIGGFAVRWVPPFRKRVDAGLKRVYPEMSRQRRNEIAVAVGRNTGRTLSEILFNAEFGNKVDRFHASGPGIEVLKQAKAAGKGTMIVSGHFGQWEAIRHYLKSQGMETGAMYRPNSNQWYEPHMLEGIRKGGAPIFARGSQGTRQMIRHLRSGGFFSMLVDQYVQHAENIPFLGHETLTTLSPAELALRYDIPLVPVFGLRAANGRDVNITFQDPIPPSDPVTMMTEYNNRISEQIHADPGQWYWLHKRWKDV